MIRDGRKLTMPTTRRRQSDKIGNDRIENQEAESIEADQQKENGVPVLIVVSEGA